VRSRSRAPCLAESRLFVFEYDWDRLQFIRKKFDQARPVVLAELDRFEQFLRGMLDAEER
jgi:hypothetical protein